MTTKEAVTIIQEFVDWSFSDGYDIPYKPSEIKEAVKVIGDAYNQAISDVAERWDSFPFPVKKEDILKMRKS